jgi:hypothetical protein
MEDSHALVAPFNQVHGQGFFAVFDGHAGKHAAEWCGQHFHEVRLPLPSNGPAGELISPGTTVLPRPPCLIAPVPPKSDEEQPDVAYP